MFGKEDEKELVWIGSSLKDLREFPDDVKDVAGFALGCVQEGSTPPEAKPLNQGKLKGKGIFEIVDDYDGDTYRAVYTVKLKERIYVLHAFQKKSKKGKETPKADIDLIKSRYDDAVDLHEMFNKKSPDRGMIDKCLGKWTGKSFPG